MLIEKYLVSSFYHRRRTRAITPLVKQHKLQNWNTGYLVSSAPIIKHQQLTLNRGHSIFNLPVTKLTQDHLQSIFQFAMQHCHKNQSCYPIIFLALYSIYISNIPLIIFLNNLCLGEYGSSSILHWCGISFPCRQYLLS